ncbi:hypothetical protein VNO77_09848 [Canavalia gladiata]|uniref:Uncharacterized protein n=1 Tax=Canavalia gladiata TaxID=3824 RepID=A0AAN9MAC8_CANGL
MQTSLVYFGTCIFVKGAHVAVIEKAPSVTYSLVWAISGDTIMLEKVHAFHKAQGSMCITSSLWASRWGELGPVSKSAQTIEVLYCFVVTMKLLGMLNHGEALMLRDTYN